MIIFLYGPDSFRIHQKTQEIIKKYRSKYKSGLNFKIIDGKEVQDQDLRAVFSTSSMFQEKKLIVLKNFFQNKEAQEIILEKKEEILPLESKTILVILESELTEKEKKSEIFKFLTIKGKSQEFPLLEGQRLLIWILKKFKEKGFYYEKGVPEKLEDYIGSDLWRLENELQKLFLFRNKEKKIFLKDVDLLVRPKIEADIFRTIDQLVSRDKKNFLTMIHSHIEKGDSPLYLLSMIIFQLRNLLLVEELKRYPQLRSALVSSLGIKPFIIRKLSLLNKNLGSEQIRFLYQKIFEIETKIKTGEIEPVLGLDLFVAEI